MINKLPQAAARVLLGAIVLSACGDASDAMGDAAQTPPDAAAPGSLLWALALGGEGEDWGTIATDQDGNVFVVGSFTSSIELGDGPVQSAGQRDGFIAKLSASGEPVWSRRFGDTGDDYATAVAVGADGNPVVVGYFQGQVDFGGGSRASLAGAGDLFGAKYAGSDGDHLWSHAYGGNGLDGGNAVAVDPSGAVLVTGSFQATANFGGAFVCSRFNSDIFVAKYEGDTGAHIWSRGFAGPGTNTTSAIATDADGNVIITGSFWESIDFGGASFFAGGPTIFLAKYRPSGEHAWSKTIMGNRPSGGRALATIDGDILLAGHFAGRLDFGGGEIVSVSTGVGLSRDAFVARYGGSGGAYVWAFGIGGVSNKDDARAIAVEQDGTIIVVGSFEQTIALGQGRLDAIGGTDAFVATFSPADGAHLWSISLGGPEDDTGLAVGAADGDTLVVAGHFSDQLTIDTTTLIAAGQQDVFIAAVAQ